MSLFHFLYDGLKSHCELQLARQVWGITNCYLIGPVYWREYMPGTKPMTGKVLGPRGEYITGVLLNGHLIKMPSTYLYLHS